jgi:hypothetical protein
VRPRITLTHLAAKGLCRIAHLRHRKLNDALRALDSVGPIAIAITAFPILMRVVVTSEFLRHFGLQRFFDN